MLHVSHAIDLKIERDGAGLSSPDFIRDATDPAAQVISTRFDAYAGGSLYLPSDGTPVSLGRGGLAVARGFYVELLGGAAQVWLNQPGAETDAPGSFVLRPATPGAAAHLYMDVEVDSLQAASLDGTALRGAFIVWGFSRPQSA